MSLVPADGLYRRRIFHSGRHASRRMMAMRLAAMVAGSGVFLSPTLPATTPIGPLTLASGSAATEGDAVAAVLPEQPAAPAQPVSLPVSEPKPADEVVPLATASNAATSPAMDAPTPAPAVIPIAATVAPTPPVAAQASPSPTPSVAAKPSPPPSPPAAARTKPPQTFMELTYYSDRASARRGAVRLRRMWGPALAGMPLQVMPAEARGKTIWRVVAGPAASRERAEKFCSVVHRAGRTCSVAAI
ncbi:MAG TPA: SPOR domain-containing protein [Stellaceae bacterium]|nr:SPOR domain-containing protein [Stellaceae bacterium]